MKREASSTIVLMLVLTSILFSAFIIQPVKAEPTIWTVDDDLQDCPDADFTRIQDAVNAATDRDTILVYPGHYSENVHVNKRLTIKSYSGAETTIVEAAYTHNDVFCITADYVNISGFTVKGATRGPETLEKAGIYLHNVDYCNISNNIAMNNDYGIFLPRSSNNLIMNNNANHNKHIGIYLSSSSSNNLIANNNVSNNHGGIVLSSSSNNIIANNYAWSNFGGIDILSLSNNNTIINNDVSNNCNGIYLSSSSNNLIVNNHIQNNYGSGYSGIDIRYSSSNNIVTNNGISGNTYGIHLVASSNNTVYHNNIVDNAQQVSISNSKNIWDNGYPSGGNYWSDYTDVDLYSGPYQNETGSDGIWDHPYVIDENNTDRYPLVNPWTLTAPWPMFRHDPQHTGRSPFIGPRTTDPEVWIFVGGDSQNEWDYYKDIVIDGDGVLYFGARINGKSGLYAFMPDGTQKWSYIEDSLGILGSPAIGPDGTIYASSNKGMLAINPDGTLKWRQAFADIYSEVNPVIGESGILYYVAGVILPDNSLHSSLIAFNKDGKIVWLYDIQGDQTYFAPEFDIAPNGVEGYSSGGYYGVLTPAIGPDGTIYLSFGNSLYAIYSNGTKKWQKALLEDSTVTLSVPVISEDGTIFILADYFVAISPEGEILWKSTIRGTLPLLGPKGKLYTVYSYLGKYATSPSYYLYAIDSSTGEVELLVSYVGPLRLSLVDAEGNLYGTKENNVVCFDSSGNKLWEYSRPEWSRTENLALDKNGTLYVPGNVPIGRSGAPAQKIYAIRDPPLTPPPKFRIGDWVQVTANLNVREGPGLSYIIISTMPLGTIGQIVGGPVEADGFVWWDVDYAVGVRGWSAENWLELYPVMEQPPTCAVELQKDGVEIDKIDVGVFFDIYVGGSISYRGIKQVRFSSDDVRDGYPTGEWTEWYDWDISSGDWDAEAKIKRWAFATPGYKEVWAEVKDKADYTAFGFATIFVPAPALPVLTSPLVITPVKDVYNVGDSLEAEFTIKNIGDTPITLDVLTVGGRLNGWLVVDFTHESVTLQPEESHQYHGSLTLTQRGNYRFFVAYHIENPTSDEKRLLDENNWNTCVELGEGLTHNDRTKNIIVFEKDIVPEDVIQLRNLIDRLKGLDTYIPPYLLDDKSFGGSVATLWMYWKSFFTDAWETYDMHYFAGLDYEYLRVKSLILAGDSLDRGDIEEARKLVQTSIEFGELSVKSFQGAFEVYDRNLEQVESIARFVKDRSQALAKAIVTVVFNPTAGKALDYFFLITDYLINRELLGVDEATKIAIRDGVIKFLYNEWEFFDEMTLSEAVRVKPPFKLLTLQDYIKSSKTLPDKLYDVIVLWIYGDVASSLSKKIADWLSGGIDYLQAKEFSPVELRAYNSQGKIVGVVDGEVRHGIPRSMYDNGTVTIFFPFDTYRFEVAGTDEGTYGLEITSVKAGNVTEFTATDIPTSSNTIHQYTIDWDALSLGEEGVTVQVDSDGDGVFEHTFTSDSELTQSEYVIATDKTPPETWLDLGDPKFLVNEKTYLTSATPIALIAEDDPGGSGVALIAYRIYNASYDSGWITYTQLFYLAGLSDGTYQIDYNSTDYAGNVEPTNTVTVILDNTPPKTTLTIGEPKYVSDTIYVTPDTPFILEANDVGSGVYSTVYRIYNSTYDSGWLLYTAPFNLTALTDGVYTIEFYSTDNLGNIEATCSIQVTLFSWDYIFTDSYGRGTTLKINTEHKFFQFITQDKDYGIRNATYMRVYRRSVVIYHKDDELRLITLAVDTKLDFCVALAWDRQTRTRYILIDKAGTEN